MLEYLRGFVCHTANLQQIHALVPTHIHTTAHVIIPYGTGVAYLLSFMSHKYRCDGFALILLFHPLGECTEIPKTKGHQQFQLYGYVGVCVCVVSIGETY